MKVLLLSNGETVTPNYQKFSGDEAAALRLAEKAVPDGVTFELVDTADLPPEPPRPKRSVTSEDLFVIMRAKGQLSDSDLPGDVKPPA